MPNIIADVQKANLDAIYSKTFHRVCDRQDLLDRVVDASRGCSNTTRKQSERAQNDTQTSHENRTKSMSPVAVFDSKGGNSHGVCYAS